MPYSESAHCRPVASLLSALSNIRAGLGSLAVPLLPALRLPVVDLRGKQAIVTGANSGIGFEVAKALAGMGARVVLACRNAERGEQARRRIMEAVPLEKVEVEILDCASFESVRGFVNRWETREHKRVDILVNNAGGILNTLTRTRDGFEDAYQSNHLAHVLLTHSFLKHGYLAPDARIVTVSSIAFFSSPPLDEHNTDSSDITANYKEGETLKWETMVNLYDRAKASQAMWSMVLQRKLEESTKWKDIVVQVCHPALMAYINLHSQGIVQSSMLSQPKGAGAATGGGLEAFKRLVQMVGISNEQGAVVPTWLATAAEPARPELRGLYWDRMRWMWVPAWCLEVERQNKFITTRSEPQPSYTDFGRTPTVRFLAIQAVHTPFYTRSVSCHVSQNYENSDLDSAINSLSSDLATLATLLESKPREYLEEEPDELTIWRESAFMSLQRLKGVVSNKRDILTAPERAKIIFISSIFVGQDGFIDNRCKTMAQAKDCLSTLGPLDRPTAYQVLLEHLKLIFQSAVHPGVRQDTGRIKQNSLDVHNMYDEQPWKTHGVGSWNVLAWVLSNIESDSIESLWPLIIPPLLTLVDDYAPAYKIKGIMATEALLRKAPASLLRRTGIDELLFKVGIQFGRIASTH
ncbi:hypothetical protein FRC10_006829 [Ceratobasidium sp. 414]|nr:hypothetical protein FRC10_006829 [Ceratobasidium sp. 414]